MSRRARTILFFFAAAALAALFAWGLRDLPPLGDYRGPYGNVISNLAVYERHTTDIVNAITYDYRGFDTLGEEYILYASVLGVLLLFRKQPAQQQEEQKREQCKLEDQIPVSDAIRVAMQAMVAVMIVFGIYIATHGQLSPGGGFQGGVLLATAPLLVYLSGRIEIFQRVVSSPLLKLCESLGAAAYALIGVGALFAGANFLTNFLPLGKTGSLLSSGIIETISIAVSFEVTGGFVLLMKAYLEEILESQRKASS